MTRTLLPLQIVLAILLSGCGSSPSLVRDSAPAHVPVDLAKVPDAIPRAEPRSRYGNPKSYSVFGVTYTTLATSDGYVERGGASWYGTKFHGRRTSSGEPYNMYAMTAAHKSLPIPTYVKVTNLENGKQVTVRVNDRGPFHEGRIIDLSYAAAARLDMLKQGTARVEVRAIDVRQQANTPPPAVTGTTHEDAEPSSNTLAQVSVAPPKASLPPAKQLFVQVGAYSKLNNADQVKQRLLEAGLSNATIFTENLPNSALHKVQLGPIRDLDAADALRLALEKLGLSQVSYISR